MHKYYSVAGRDGTWDLFDLRFPVPMDIPFHLLCFFSAIYVRHTHFIFPGGSKSQGCSRSAHRVTIERGFRSRFWLCGLAVRLSFRKLCGVGRGEYL